MYIDIVPNRNSRPAVLLREGKREGTKIVKRTVANMTDWPKQVVDAIRLALRQGAVAPLDEVFTVERSIPHGHVEAILGVMRLLEMDALLASRPCRERTLVLAMIAQRLVDPCSKLAAIRQWQSTSLAEELGVKDADEDALYAALDWLLDRQVRIEAKLAKRHLKEGARVLFDVSSSSYHGHSCSLARFGYNRDGEKLPSIVYGLLADAQGRPIAVDVYPGNTADPSTVPDQVDKLRERFGLERVVLVGDRGMLTQTRIDALKQHPQLGWISALRSRSIAQLVEQGELQLSLFDEQNLAEIQSEAYPGERLMVCYNPLLAQDRRRTRNELLEASEKELTRIAAYVEQRTKTLLKADEIGLKVGKAIQRFKMAKHFTFDIQDGHLCFRRDEQHIRKEEQLDGIYVIRTSEPQEKLSAQDTVRAYKSLGQVEQAFRCLKGLDLRIRPIHHRTEDHVKAHIFLCMLAYYVEWHMRKALAPILFQDEQLDDNRWTRDPVAKAKPSPVATHKKVARKTEDGWPIHSFQTLLDELATRCKNTCRSGQGANTTRFNQVTEFTPFQRHVHELLELKS